MNTKGSLYLPWSLHAGGMNAVGRQRAGTGWGGGEGLRMTGKEENNSFRSVVAVLVAEGVEC